MKSSLFNGLTACRAKTSTFILKGLKGGPTIISLPWTN